jgi:hypothetical protein
MIPYNKSRKGQQVDKEVDDFFAWVESQAAKYEVTCDYILEEFVLDQKTNDKIDVSLYPKLYSVELSILVSEFEEFVVNKFPIFSVNFVTEVSNT